MEAVDEIGRLRELALKNWNRELEAIRRSAPFYHREQAKFSYPPALSDHGAKFYVGTARTSDMGGLSERVNFETVRFVLHLLSVEDLGFRYKNGR